VFMQGPGFHTNKVNSRYLYPAINKIGWYWVFWNGTWSELLRPLYMPFDKGSTLLTINFQYSL
jgi:hypothetical protein